MPKYDAFGREIGEDTLKGLGNTSSEPAQDRHEEAVPAEPSRPDPQPAPAQPAKPEFVTKATDNAQRREMASQLSGMLKQAAARPGGAQPTLTVRRSGSAKGCLVAIVVVLLIGGALIAGVASFVSSVSDEVGKIKLPTAPTVAGPAPKGLAGESMMRPAAVSAALGKLRSDESTKLTHLRIAPERIDAQLLTDEGRLRSVQFKPGGKMEQLGSDSGPGFDTAGTIPYARLRPGAPARLARQGAQKLRVPVSTVQYAVPTYSGAELFWAVYFEHAHYVLGDARGRFQRAF